MGSGQPNTYFPPLPTSPLVEVNPRSVDLGLTKYDEKYFNAHIIIIPYHQVLMILRLGEYGIPYVEIGLCDL
jgi:hypothetical protein